MTDDAVIAKKTGLTIDEVLQLRINTSESILSLSDMKSTEQALYDHRAVVDGLFTSQEIRRVRKKLKLTQKEAAEIFGGGSNAFSRYELGESTPARAVDNLLRLLDKHPELLDEITRNVAA